MSAIATDGWKPGVCGIRHTRHCLGGAKQLLLQANQLLLDIAHAAHLALDEQVRQPLDVVQLFIMPADQRNLSVARPGVNQDEDITAIHTIELALGHRQLRWGIMTR